MKAKCSGGGGGGSCSCSFTCSRSSGCCSTRVVR